MVMKFTFLEFNTRRNMRGAAAARVEISDENGNDWLWMSKRDIAENIKQFGPDPELIKAKEAYKK